MNPRLASRRSLGAFALLLVIQTAPAILTGVAATRRLEQGTPIELAVVPRDPRDLFKGDYSVLAYDLGRYDGPVDAEAWTIVGTCLSAKEACRVRQGTPIYAELEPVAGDLHRMKRLTFARPRPGTRYIRGETVVGTLRQGAAQHASGTGCAAGEVCLSGTVTYGIERFYGPQGEPAKIDRLPRDQLRVRVRLGDDGRALLDAVLLNGTEKARTARLW